LGLVGLLSLLGQPSYLLPRCVCQPLQTNTDEPVGRGEPDLKFSDSSDSQLCSRALEKSAAIDGRAAQPPALSNSVRARRGDAFPGAQQQRTWTTLTSSSGFATVTLLIGRCTVRPAFLTPDPYQQEPKLKSTQPSLHPSTGRRLMT